ncbi:Gfo/Idh/MocA family oxidoreductase [Thermostilla marina]
MRKLRIGVVGCGRLGGFHAQKLAAMKDVDLVGVVDPVPQRAAKLADECDTIALSEPQALIGKVDAVVIAASTSAHHALARAFLDAGIHVFVEKPITVTDEEAQELIRLAEANGLVLQVGHVERFNPAFQAVLPYADSPKFIEASRCGPFTFRSMDVGVVLDLMIHDIDLVLSLVRSRPVQVDALGVSVLGGEEDVAHAVIRFESGCTAVLKASRVAYEPVRAMSIWTPRSWAKIDFAARTAEVVEPSETLLARRLDVRNLSPDELEYYKENLYPEHLPRTRIVTEPADAIRRELRDFVDSIRTPRRPLVTGYDGAAALSLAHAILDSLAEHRWDEKADGLAGPHALPRPAVVPAPHFRVVNPAETPGEKPFRRREAG